MFSLPQRRTAVLLPLVVLIGFSTTIYAQTKRPSLRIQLPQQKTQKKQTSPSSAVVIDERLSLLLPQPNIYAVPIERMRRGRELQISADKIVEGLTFYRVSISKNKVGWVQSEALATKIRRGDDERLARLIQSSEGFDQIERIMIFLKTFPNSALRPTILLLLGDVMEETAKKISSEAGKRLDKNEMSASGAPLHSFYLNYTSLDRYRRLGIGFIFNSAVKRIHYDGVFWDEIIKKYPTTNEAAEAKKRLDSLRQKMATVKQT